MAKREIYMETFLNYNDAITWWERTLDEKKGENIVDASIRWVNNHWMASAIFGDTQLELEFD